MNFKIKIRISILLCLTLLFYSFQPVRSVGAASIGEPVPTDVSYWGFDENTTSSILNQGYNNILCLWDFENHEYLLVKCPDHMYYIPGGRVLIDGDYTGLFNKKEFSDYIRDQIVYSWGKEKGFFNLSASQYFTVYRVSSDGNLNSSEQSEFNGVVNGTAWSSSKTKYNALRWLYENDSETYNLCNYALLWSTDSIDYAYTGSGNGGIDFYNWANAVLLSNINYTSIYFTGGSTLNAAASDLPVYTFYPGGFRFSSPVVVSPTPTPSPLPAPLKPWNDYDNTDSFYYVVKCLNSPEGSHYLVDHYYGVNAGNVYYPSYANYRNNSLLFDYDYYALLDKFVYSSSSRCDEVKYDIELNDYSSDGERGLNVLGNDSTVDGFTLGGFPLRADSIYKTFRSRNYSTNYNTFEGTDWVISNSLENKFGGYRFELVATNHSLTVNSFNNTGSDNIVPPVAVNTPSPSPVPTSSPTPTPYTPVYVSPTPSPVPSPGVTITPTQGPSETSVKELRGWKKALRDILQTVFVGNTEAIEGYFKDAVGGYQIVQNPFKQIVDSIYIDGSDQENFNPFENQQVDFIFDVHDQDGNVLGGEHTTNWRLTILPKTFWEWLKSYSDYFEIVFYMVDASFLGATMKRWLTKQNDEGSETKEGGGG